VNPLIKSMAEARLRGDLTRWLAGGPHALAGSWPRLAAMKRAARSPGREAPGREAHPRSSLRGPGPDPVADGHGRGVPAH
jgi:hypothetical protein